MSAFSRRSGRRTNGSQPSTEDRFWRGPGDTYRDPSGQSMRPSTPEGSQANTMNLSRQSSIPNFSMAELTIPSFTPLDVIIDAEFAYIAQQCEAEIFRARYWGSVNPENRENKYTEQVFGDTISYPCPYSENRSLHAAAAYAQLKYYGNKVGEPKGDEQRWYLGAEVEISGRAWPDAKIPKPVTGMFPKDQSREECLGELLEEFNKQMGVSGMKERLDKYQRSLVHDLDRSTDGPQKDH